MRGLMVVNQLLTTTDWGELDYLVGIHDHRVDMYL